MLDQDWGAGLVGTVDSSSVVKRFIKQPYKVLGYKDGVRQWVEAEDTKFDIEKYLAGDILLDGFPEPMDYEFMSPEEAYEAELGLEEFDKKIGAYAIAVARGDVYDSLGIPLKGTVTAEQEQLLKQLPPDQRDRILDKMNKASDLNDELEEKFKNPEVLTKRPELDEELEDIPQCEECIFGYNFC